MLLKGSTITLEEVRDIVQNHMAPNKPLRDVKESEAHSNIFLNMIKHKQTISGAVLLKWHKDIFKETKKDIAGKLRSYLVRVGYYIAPDWQDLKKLIRGLVNFTNKKLK